MIYGDEVSGKYSVIIAGRCQELYAGIAYADRSSKHQQIAEFIDTIRNCDMDQFNQWYQLYKDTIPDHLPKRKPTL